MSTPVSCTPAGVPGTSLDSTTTNSTRKALPSVFSTLPNTLATFYVRNAHHPKGQLFHVSKPIDIQLTPVMGVTRPKFAKMRQQSMHMLTPCVFYVQYPCEQKCRNLGICIHYQFVVGCKRAPDGLRCDICVRSGVEEAIHACRKCPLHQNPTQANPIGSRPEDFIVTDLQKAICDEILTRSLTCRWGDVPNTTDQASKAHITPAPFAARPLSKTPAPPRMNSPLVATTPGTSPATNYYSVMPNNNTLPSFDRETTPRTFKDVKRLENLEEGNESGVGSNGQDRYQSSRRRGQRNSHLAGAHATNLPELAGGPLGMAMGLAHGRSGQQV